MATQKKTINKAGNWMLAVALVMGNGSFLLPNTVQTAHAAVVEPVVLGNAGFETVGTNGELANWAQFVPATAASSDFSVVDSPVREGGHAYKLSATGLNTNEKAYLHQEVPIEQNREYVLTGYLNVEQLENAIAQLYVEYADADGQILAGGTVDQTTVTDGYVRVQNNRLAPTGATSMRVYVTLKALGDNASGTFHADGLNVHQTNALLQNTDFEAYEGATGTVDYWPVYQHPGTNVETSVVSSPVASGAKAQKVVGSAMPNGKAVGVHQMVTAEPNTPYTVTGQFNVESLDNAKVQLYVDFWDKDHNWLGMSIADQTEATNGAWVTLKNEHISPEGTAFFTVFALVRANAEGAGGTFYVDDINVVRANADLVPTMVGNTAPLGLAAANYNDSNAHLAFDEKHETSWGSGTYTGTLKYDFKTPATAYEYELVTSSPTYAPRTWTVQGSNDGSNWRDVDSKSEVTAWTGGVSKRYAVTQPGSYKMYRIVISKNNGSGNTVLSEFRLFGSYQTPEKLTGLWNTNSGDKNVSLEWRGVNGAVEYRVYQDGDLVQTVPSTGKTLVGTTLSELTNNRIYRYEVTAVNAAGESIRSDVARAMPYTQDLVLYPEMTSNNAPLGAASANYGNDNAYLAFDHKDGTSWASGTYTGELTYGFLTPTRIREYTILPSSPTFAPTNFQLQGSNDKQSWTKLDEQTGITNWTSGTRKFFALDDSKMPVTQTYKHYKLVVTKNNGGGNTTISELQLVGSYDIPETPAGLWNTDSGKDFISLEWKGVNGAKAYHVYRGNEKVMTVPSEGSNLVQATINGLPNNEPQLFSVSAENEAGESQPSAQIRAMAYAPEQVLYPIMTSNNAPLGTASANYGNDNAYLAFDHKDGTSWASGTYTGELTYGFLTSTRIREYTILPSSPTYGPTDFQLQGSNDKLAWTTLDQQTGITNWTTGKRKFFTLDDSKLPVTQTYKYFKLVVTKNNGGGNTTISELQLVGSYDVPETPAGLWNIESGNGTVNLEWQGVNGANEYHVYQDGAKVMTILSEGSSLAQAAISGLSNNQIYKYSVTASNDVGESPASGEILAVPYADSDIVTPLMTTNTSPTGVVSANYGNANAYLAFDRKDISSWASGTYTGTLTHDLQQPALLHGYTILPSSPSYAPSTFMLQGSNDGAEWITLDEKSNVSNWTNGKRKYFTIDTSVEAKNTAYRMFRLVITKNNGGGNTTIAELQLIGTQQ